jgi:hypothetical protein
MGKVKPPHAKVFLEMDNNIADKYTGCLQIKEWTAPEPTAVEHKHYCPYTGLAEMYG